MNHFILDMLLLLAYGFLTGLSEPPDKQRPRPRGLGSSQGYWQALHRAMGRPRHQPQLSLIPIRIARSPLARQGSWRRASAGSPPSCSRPE